MLKHIKYHPLFSFAQDSGYDKYISIRSCLLNYLTICYSNIKYDIKGLLKQVPVYWWMKFKISLCKNYKIVKSIEIIDKNTDGWRCYPRYDCRIIFKNLYNDELQQQAECKWLDFWFKSYWSEVCVDLFREGYCKEDGRLIPYTYV